MVLYNEEVEIDDDCVDLVCYFNKIGLVTEFCCSGHGKDDFCIMFNSEVKDNQIEEFVSIFSNKYDHTPFLGKFSKWYRKTSGVMGSTWEYRVKKISWAKQDFKTMKGYK